MPGQPELSLNISRELSPFATAATVQSCPLPFSVSYHRCSWINWHQQVYSWPKEAIAMKERITFVHPPGAEFDPKLIEIQATGLLGPTINTMREDRLTIPLNELPAKFATLLKRLESLQIRWASPKQQNTINPFGSRISPGLHVSYTTQKDGKQDQYVVITPKLEKIRYNC